NAVFTLGKEIVYEISISKADESIFLAENSYAGYRLTTNPDSATVTKIYMKVIRPKPFKRTNKNQTEILIYYSDPPRSISSTGVVENDQNIWIHPPRQGFFKCLETCPFPYLKFGLKEGDTWQDKMSIGQNWSDPLWGEWEGRLLLDYTYTVLGNSKVKTPLGDLDCVEILATATSNIGQSKLEAMFSSEFGFVKLDYTLFDGTEISLKMVENSDGEVIRKAEDLFVN
ncbi:MAG: hypothetical protein AAGC47_02870, partial [Bacteroidota bacterium]